MLMVRRIYAFVACIMTAGICFVDAGLMSRPAQFVDLPWSLDALTGILFVMAGFLILIFGTEP